MIAATKLAKSKELAALAATTAAKRDPAAGGRFGRYGGVFVLATLHCLVIQSPAGSPHGGSPLLSRRCSGLKTERPINPTLKQAFCDSPYDEYDK